ncbi:MAG: diguanylate cyclase [Ruminococcaceae bacterium]|nr:diguanylate cyclase [Oscillospiraceae bacterium]
MKIHSMQSKILITLISAMLAITVFIGGLSIYEVDQFVQHQTEDYINVTCEKEASQINDIFGDMEKSVHIMESYVLDFINSKADIEDTKRQADILERADEMFIDVASNTDGAMAYYFRFAPELSHNTFGLFYSKVKRTDEFVRFEPTDISLYDKSDTEHVGWYWQPLEAGKPVWMLPYNNKNIDIMMISYVVPLYYDNEFIGIVGMDFDYSVLTDKVHHIKIYENGFAHLEFEGADIYNSEHAEDAKLHEHPEEYLSVSEELRNGMTLIISASYNDIRQIRYDIALKILLVVLLLAVLFSCIAIFIVKKIVHPLKKLTDASVKLSNQEYDVEIIQSDTYEINLLSIAFENMALQLKEHEKLQHLLAYRDSLTGLRNTNSYWAWITDFDKEIESKEIVFGVIVFDINYLKETNDRYGHDVGNKLIVSAARVISDIFKRSPVFRIGGDEFLVILQNRDLDDVEELLKIFDEECLSKSVDTDKESIPVSIAKGFARYDFGKDTNFMDVFNRADDAMYENKRKIKGLK